MLHQGFIILNTDSLRWLGDGIIMEAQLAFLNNVSQQLNMGNNQAEATVVLNLITVLI